MQYPSEFIEKCKRLYPNWCQLHTALENGSESVAYLLDNAAPTCVSFSTVMLATSLADLRDQVRPLMERRELLHECNDLLEAAKSHRAAESAGDESQKDQKTGKLAAN